MTLPSYLNFTNNIRTHATFVGVLLALDAIITLLMRAAWDVKPEDLPKELQHIAHLKDVLLAVGIVNALVTIMYWVGFLKRVRWCLTVFIGFMAVVITLQFIGLLGAMLQLNIISACVMLIVLAANAYVLLVTLQLRQVNSNFTVPQDGFSV
ncbi:uncharacterized protein LOC128305482 [Anopheles moucheti]|uniref:uncharacterized protein LOC128305482 n=1 Tax=Anopheles moucheti TaxID=186751 RepID=UPI0022F0DABE|nr:uncharacterized protein LOC128305482 [Anopheles moucheti]